MRELSVTKKSNKAKLTDLGARHFAIHKQVLISKFAFGPEKLSDLASTLYQIFFKNEIKRVQNRIELRN